MNDPLFSVVIPTHDRPEFLAEAVASVLAQTEPDLECIVVDDAGSVEATVPSDPRARVVRHTVNAGPAAARNTGVEAARGRFVAFLDDDDRYEPRRVADARAVLERAPLAICWAAWMGEEHPRGRRLEGRVYDEILDEITPHVSTLTFARTAFVPFDESYPASAELEWLLRMVDRLEVSTDERVGVRLRRHSAARHGNDAGARVAASLQLLADHHDYFRSHRRAHAFRWSRIGLLALDTGRRGEAARAFLRSLWIRPRARTLYHLARTALPARSG